MLSLARGDTGASGMSAPRTTLTLTGLVDSPTEGLLIDGTPVQAPYVIEVIGDPYTLATALDFDGGFIEEVENVDGEVRVEELDTVEIASTSRLPVPTFAEPVEQE